MGNDIKWLANKDLIFWEKIVYLLICTKYIIIQQSTGRVYKYEYTYSPTSLIGSHSLFSTLTRSRSKPSNNSTMNLSTWSMQNRKADTVSSQIAASIGSSINIVAVSKKHSFADALANFRRHYADYMSPMWVYVWVTFWHRLQNLVVFCPSIKIHLLDIWALL